MQSVICNDDTCLFNQNGCCSKESINIEIKFGRYENGQQIVYNACQNYESNKDSE